MLLAAKRNRRVYCCHHRTRGKRYKRDRKRNTLNSTENETRRGSAHKHLSTTMFSFRGRGKGDTRGTWRLRKTGWRRKTATWWRGKTGRLRQSAAWRCW